MAASPSAVTFRVPLSTQAAQSLSPGPSSRGWGVSTLLPCEAPACGVPVGHPEGKPHVHGSWSPHSETAWGMSCPPRPGSRGLPLGQVLGGLGGHQAWLVFTRGVLALDFHLTLSTRPLRSVRGGTQAGSLRTLGNGTRGVSPRQHKPSADHWRHSGRPAIWFLNISIFVGVHEYFINFI